MYVRTRPSPAAAPALLLSQATIHLNNQDIHTVHSCLVFLSYACIKWWNNNNNVHTQQSERFCCCINVIWYGTTASSRSRCRLLLFELSYKARFGADGSPWSLASMVHTYHTYISVVTCSCLNGQRTPSRVYWYCTYEKSKPWASAAVRCECVWAHLRCVSLTVYGTQEEREEELLSKKYRSKNIYKNYEHAIIFIFLLDTFLVSFFCRLRTQMITSS